MKIAFKVAQNSDIDRLVILVREYYEYDHHPFDEGVVRTGLAGFLSDETLGRLWVIHADDEAVGYMALTPGYSLTYGRYAFIDEIYVRQNYRRQGIGRRAIAFAEEVCHELKVKALHLEVEQANTRACALYTAVGFVDYNHYFMTCWLASENSPVEQAFQPASDTRSVESLSHKTVNIFMGSDRDDSLGITFTPAQNSDIETLVKLRQEAGTAGQADSRAAIGQLVSDASLGRVWLIQLNNKPVGYVVVTFSYSLEFHGRDALLDELYLRRDLYRQDGAVESLKFAQAQGQALGVNALHAEMERANAPAQALYRTVGFEDDDSYLMTKWIETEA